MSDSKLLWTLGNFSRFIRPQARRVEVSCEGLDSATDPEGLMVSAYVNADGSRVAVVINYSGEEREISLGWGRRTVWRAYRTSDRAGENLAPVGKVNGTAVTAVPPRSVVTFVGM
ncbi:MAG: hypothetical protein NC114_11575 [Ruminococcus flavefaciens]|nr:hypothetical protein [Ruminococcus flavefaciens]